MRSDNCYTGNIKNGNSNFRWAIQEVIQVFIMIIMLLLEIIITSHIFAKVFVFKRSGREGVKDCTGNELVSDFQQGSEILYPFN